MKRFLSCLLLVLPFAAAAPADSIHEAFSFAPSVTPFIVLSGSIPAFNPTLGTLHSIDITLSATAIGTVTVGNRSGSAGTFSFSVTSPLELLDPTLASILTVQPSFAGSLVIPIDGVKKSAVLVSPTVTDSVTLTSGFAPYTGTAYSLVLFAAAPTVMVSGPGSFLAAGSSTASSAGGEVTYNFDPRVVPEPSAAALLVFGVVAAAAYHGLKRK